jgi:hypothetical protein
VGQIKYKMDLAETLTVHESHCKFNYAYLPTMQKLEEDEGLLREALTSLYKLFDITREILKTAGPDAGVSLNAVGGTAIAVLNEGLRPFLSKWHPKPEKWEAQRSEMTSRKEHEKIWNKEPELRSALADLRRELAKYANSLAKISEIKE